MGLVHTHRHSEYSLLDGVGTSIQYAERAAQLGQSALAQTDHGNLCGALHHYTACKEIGIKPILGVEAYFTPNRLLKTTESKNYHLVLLAQNESGWRNLLKLVSEAYDTGFYFKPRVDYELLRLWGNDISCGNACVSSIISRKILLGEDCREDIESFLDIFGENFYFEIMPHDFPEQQLLNKSLIQYSQIYDIPIAATVDAHTPYKEWTDTQDIVIMIATGQTFEDRKRKKEAGEDTYLEGCDTLYLMDEEQLIQSFRQNHQELEEKYIIDAISHTQHIADSVEEFAIDKSRKMPKVHVDSEGKIREWCAEGLERLGIIDEGYSERLEYELEIIKSNNALDYFVIVGDLVRWAKFNGIRVGAGRGSAAGSLVSYLIGITQLDPIKCGLLFERFMNPDRIGLPDIDLDFSSERREEVKSYLASKWGENNVADICSFQTFKPKAAVQKVGRVYGLYEATMRATKDIPVLASEDLEDLKGIYPELNAYAEAYPEAWVHSCRLQGQVHTLSKHAGGVVVTEKPLYEYMPTMLGNSKKLLTQWGARADFNIIDDYGFMKIDLLGIVGLDTQELACQLIGENHGVDIDLNEMPILRDPHHKDDEVFDAFSRGLVLGVWQFTGSPGFEGLVKSFKPTWLGDLAAANAIYRPGPLGGKVNVSYVRRKFGQEKVRHFHDTVNDILDDTYGLIVYQEQIMALSKSMANFSGGDADNLRKVISKEYRLGLRHVKKVLKERGYVEKWTKGCKENGVDKETAREVWKLILAFGDYGFNMSHAYAYAAQSYQDMWLKINYPTEFYTAYLTYNPDDISRVIREADSFGVEIGLPDINKSEREFTIDKDGKIVFGLSAIKNLGLVGVKEILEKKPFSSYQDFTDRVKPRAVNSRANQSLVDSGAFDSFGARDEFNSDYRSSLEKQAIGVAISNKKDSGITDKIIEANLANHDLEEIEDEAEVALGGELTRAKKIKTKNGKSMAFFTVQHKNLEWNCTIFPNCYGEFVDLIEEGKLVMVRGHKDTRNTGEVSVIVDVMCGVYELQQEIASDAKESYATGYSR